MKISNSKKQLAKIISENGGWRDGAEFSAQDQDGDVFFYAAKPTRSGGLWLHAGGLRGVCIARDEALPNWHQTILSRDEYFHLYPAQDADGWIEWNGGKCPIDSLCLIEARARSGEIVRGYNAISHNWAHDGSCRDLVAYRLHKQEHPNGIEPTSPFTPAPTIEQLATEYRNRKDYAERKQQEADDAKADAEAKLAELVAGAE